MGSKSDTTDKYSIFTITTLSHGNFGPNALNRTISRLAQLIAEMLRAKHGMRIKVGSPPGFLDFL